MREKIELNGVSMVLERIVQRNRRRLNSPSTMVAMGIVSLGLVLTVPASAEESPERADPQEALTESLFSPAKGMVPEGTTLSDEEQSAILGRRFLSGGTSGGGVQGWSLIKSQVEQSLQAEVIFRVPQGVDLPLPPITLSLASARGSVYVNKIPFGRERAGSDMGKGAKFFLELRRGVRLVLIRPALANDALRTAAMLCLNLDYTRLEGRQREMREADRVPLVAQTATFSMTSTAHASFQSGVKPAVLRVWFDRLIGLAAPKITEDQGARKNPRVRLVYVPSGPAVSHSFSGAPEALAQSTYQFLSHAWFGNEMLKTYTDELVIRRVTPSDTLERFLRVSVKGGRLRGPMECLYARWTRYENLERRVDTDSELHTIVRRIAD